MVMKKKKADNTITTVENGKKVKYNLAVSAVLSDKVQYFGCVREGDFRFQVFYINEQGKVDYCKNPEAFNVVEQLYQNEVAREIARGVKQGRYR